MILMFFTCLKIDLADFRRIKIEVIFVALFLILVFMPLLSLVGIIFKPLIFTGILLAFSCPSAVSTAFFSDALKGNSSLAIVLTMITSLISIVTLPITMLIGVGTMIKFDAFSMITNLIQIVLIPLLAAISIRRYFRRASESVLKYGNFLSNILLIFILWGGVASGINHIEIDMKEFLVINLVITFLLTIALLISYNLGKMFSRKDAITLAIATLMKNSVLALVIGIITFGSEVMPALVAHLIGQNVLLIPLVLFLR
ncbi:MAG: bile acid:sodium symporter [Nitrososphaerales archaeon]